MDRQALQLGRDDTRAGHHQRRLQRARLRPRRPGAHPRGGRQSAPDRAAGTEARRHPPRSTSRTSSPLFGDGRHPRFDELYRDVAARQLSRVRPALLGPQRHWFAAPMRATASTTTACPASVARGFRAYLQAAPEAARGHRGAVRGAARSTSSAHIYDSRIEPLLWSKAMNWTLSRQLTMSLLGVPHPQRREVSASIADGRGRLHPRGDRVRRSRNLPFWSNYFWARVPARALHARRAVRST